MNSRPRPRIGVDLHVFDGKFQGSRSHLIGIFGELTRLCPEFQFVFLLEKTAELGRLPGFSEPNVERVHMPHAGALKRLGLQLPAQRRALKLDLLHTQYVMPLQPARGNAVTIHDVLFEPYPQFFGRLFVLRSRLLMRWSARAADLLFTVSDYSRAEIAQRYGVPAEKIGVLHNAVDRQVFFPGEAGAERVRARGLQPGGYLLTVGRIEPRKNHAALLRAYRLLPGTPPPLVIVGQRDFGYGDFETELAQMPAGRQVLLLDDVGDGELPALYRHAQIFVYPSFAEGFGMPPLEALASGVPVITSDSTAIPEVIGDAGLLIDPLDPQSLQAALSRLLADAALRAQLVQRGLARADVFTWRRSAEHLAAAYRKHFSEKA
ncbi:glycosyltransferase family 4 protein [Paucibacter sp. XJ19-41]|uniref:glycosyltransferase family 4 protein n=1 Tax=Paucibacter sp. XJ19-41 TaxID=2927824 RepID=UPI00234B4DF2|nr:glycosyltransferase family 1 protein [Paucibacter sp. XJ19-41]MDC6166635.1 glycosyltransferase family 1 protein [Paucibacter sp. XJ19-41]